MMADTVKLTSPNISVLMRDGTSWTVQTENEDLVSWDMVRAPRKWPKLDDAPFLWLTFLAWNAGKRDGLHELPWDQFKTDCRQVSTADSDDEAENVGPTLSAVEQG